jgi:small subunit ribosomal protein S6
MSVHRLYESTYIVNAALEDADIEQVVARVTEYIEQHGGKIIDHNKWGRRRLAYPIKKKHNGL